MRNKQSDLLRLPAAAAVYKNSRLALAFLLLVGSAAPKTAEPIANAGGAPNLTFPEKG